MTDTNDRKVIEEIAKAIKKVADRHGFSVPPFDAACKNKGVFINLSLYRGEDYKAAMRDLYVSQMKNLGLPESPLTQTFANHAKSRVFKLIGLDIDGGPSPVRVEDQNGVEFRLSVSALKQLVERDSL